MRWAIIIVLLASNAFCESLKLGPQFHGLKTDEDPSLIEEGETPDSENVVTDVPKGISPRSGFVSFSSEPSSNLWEFALSNGNKYLITQSSNLIKASLGVSSFSVVVSTVPLNVTIAASQFGDLWYFMNATDGLKSWDGTNVISVTSTINGDQLVTWKGRLVASGVSANKRTLYLSRALDGTVWNLQVNPTDDDPSQIQISGNRNETIKCLFSSFNDLLMWWTANSFGGLYGSRRPLFQQREFNSSIGCSYPTSIKNCDGRLRWYGGQKRAWEWDGFKIKKISELNDALFKGISQGDVNQKTWSQMSVSDWNSGNIGAYLDTTTATNSIQYDNFFFPIDDFTGTFTVTVTTHPLWNLSNNWQISGGTLSNIGDQTLLTSTNAWTGNTLSSLSNGATFSITFTANAFISSVAANNGAHINIMFMSNDQSPASGCNSCYVLRIVNSTTARASARLLKYDASGTGSTISNSAEVFIANGGTNGTWRVTITPAGSFDIYSPDGNRDIHGIADTSIVSAKYYGIYTYYTSINITTISVVYVNVSSNTSAQNTYKTFFQSQTFNIGSKITNWEPVTVNTVVSTQANLIVALYVSSLTGTAIDINNTATYTASQTIASGIVPYITTSAPNIAVGAFFSRPTSTSNYYVTLGSLGQLNNFTIRWDENATTPIPSVWYLQRLWWGVTISSNTNNKVLVYDRNTEWQRYSGINMTSAIVFNSNFYFGNSSGIWLADNGTSDNGNAINSYFTTKNYAPLAFETRNYFTSVYWNSINSGETINVSYAMDSAPSQTSLSSYAMNSFGAQYQYAKSPFTTTMLMQGNAVNFKISVSAKTPWKVLSGLVNFAPESRSISGD